MKNERDSIPAVIISATHSGAGKTTVTRALLCALRDRGLKVQAFKLGPDFIDPMYHTAITGTPCVNLDLWMMGEDGVREVFERRSRGADVAVIEGMGALHDGSGAQGEGSAAHAAAVLGVPVAVVIDVYGMTRTAGAVMDGMEAFDPSVQVAGFILNRCGREGSAAHARLIREGVGERRWERVLSVISSHPSLEIAERHLGLVTPHENSADWGAGALLAAAGQMDTDRIFSQKLIPSRSVVPEEPAVRAPRARLALARDAAFCFYYDENLRMLRNAGFEIAEFSPAGGETLPEGSDAVYFGGGYPESFAGQLEANRLLANDLKDAAARGVPIFGECGGLIWLGRSLTGFDGRTRAMSGILPVDFEMDPDHLAIRYLELKTESDSLLGPAGAVLRGHEFHQSRVVSSGGCGNLFTVTTSAGEVFKAGWQEGSVCASWAHVIFSPAAAGAFADAAAIRKG